MPVANHFLENTLKFDAEIFTSFEQTGHCIRSSLSTWIEPVGRGEFSEALVT